MAKIQQPKALRGLGKFFPSHLHSPISPWHPTLPHCHCHHSHQPLLPWCNQLLHLSQYLHIPTLNFVSSGTRIWFCEFCKNSNGVGSFGDHDHVTTDDWAVSSLEQQVYYGMLVMVHPLIFSLECRWFENVGTNVINTNIALSVYPYQVLKKVASKVLNFPDATYFTLKFTWSSQPA